MSVEAFAYPWVGFVVGVDDELGVFFRDFVIKGEGFVAKVVVETVVSFLAPVSPSLRAVSNRSFVHFYVDRPSSV